MKIIFYSTPAYGHISPALNIIKAYVDAGHEVHFYSTKTFESAIMKTGAVYHEYLFDEKRLDLTIGSKLLQLEDTILSFALELTDNLFSEAKTINPNLILHDNIAMWGRIIGQVLNIKAASINAFPIVPSFISKAGMEYTMRFGGIMLKDIKFLPDIMKKKKELKSLYPTVKFNMLADILNQEDLNIITFPEPIQPGKMNDKYYFAGPTISDPDYYFSPDGDIEGIVTDNLIYISLGTVFQNNPTFYRDIIGQFKDSKYNVLIVMSEKVEEMVRGQISIPENVQIRRFVPQGKILDKAGVYIGAGGMNSILQAGARKVPCLLYPQEGEQGINSKGFCKLGMGKILKNAGNIVSLCENLQAEYNPSPEAFGYFNEPDYGKLMDRIDSYLGRTDI